MIDDYFRLLCGVLTRILFLTDPQKIEYRRNGADWPTDAETMVGELRLLNVFQLCQDAIMRGVPGDFMECGVWKGGCIIAMGAVIQKLAMGQFRRVWAADSFQGCPVPSPDKYPKDKGDRHYTFDFLRVRREDVEASLKRYNIRTDVQFLEGWFKDTLPGPVERLAVLRLDGDLYESTIQCLEALYDKVSPGGFVIIDDYGAVAGCRQAVTDFRASRGLTDTNAPLHPIDWTGVYWHARTIRHKPYDTLVNRVTSRDLEQWGHAQHPT